MCSEDSTEAIAIPFSQAKDSKSEGKEENISCKNQLLHEKWVGEEGKNPGVIGVRSLRETGGERVGGGIPKGVGSGRNQENIVQYFTIGKAHTGRNHYGRG